MKPKLGVRSTFFLVLLLISSFGCSSLGNQNNNQPTSGNSNTSSSTVAVNETLKVKPLPILGSLETQLKFEADDSLAVIANQPRPTYPETLAVLAGNPPQGTDVCNLSYAALIKAMYASCFPEGITYIAMSNIIGWAGEENSRSGDTVIYTWANRQRGTLTATFTNGRLTAKSQRGLK